MMVAAACLVAWATPAARAADPVEAVLFRPGARAGIECEVVSVTPTEVEIDRGEKVEKIPVEQIDQLSFTAEPDALRDARAALDRGDFAQAAEELGRMEAGDLDGLPPLIVAEYDYVKAAAGGGKVAGGGGDLAAGEKAVRAYLAKHAGSHHFFPMQELLSTLLARGGKFDDAAAALAPLDKGSPTFRVRAAAGRGRLLFDQRKYAEASREFVTASQLPTDPQDKASAAQKLSAEVGQARCLARLGKADDAIAAISKVIDGSAPADDRVLGEAYNALGDVHRVAGKDQDAIVAFLTVDLVYNKDGDNEAEALFNLAQLWDAAKSPLRAKKTRQDLLDQYPDTVWARKTTAAPTQ
jgi:tetratricopeptide (TPR) repeat protein